MLVLVPAPAWAAPPTTTTTPTTTTHKAKPTTTTHKAKPTTAKTKTAKTKTTKTKTAAPVGATDKKCYNALIQDWYDGRIDKTYPVHCYRDALKHLPQDVVAYSDAYDVISRALAAATRGKHRVNPNALVPPPVGGKTHTRPGETTPTGPPGGGPIAGGLNSGDRGATGIPVPLLVLGGLAILLVAAGAAGFIYRRYQGRGGGPTPS
jgi:hypothetical protein